MAGCITIFGGTGFIGRHLAALLLREGAALRIAVRHPDHFRMTNGQAPAPEIVQADILDEATVEGAVAGAEAVVNLVGVLTETGRQTYRALHVDGARRVALAARRCGASHMIHVSALGAGAGSPALSDRTKAEGERAVRAVFRQATIVRPSLVYGEGDHFFSRFAALARTSPVLPLIGGGVTRFQPVFVGDAAAGLLALLKRAESVGKTYEFGGDQVYSFKELVELLLKAMKRPRILLPIPFAVAEMQAGLLELLPDPPLTRDQVRLLKTDKVLSGTEPTLGDLGIRPQPLQEFLATFRDRTG
jgi:uncharacterized protein YbjT (DUF2867 family)